MKIVKHYRHDKTLRDSFNALAEATFGLNFENWYQNGFWGDDYAPYSVLEDGKIVANVSLNRTDLRTGDTVHRIYQLGTVMTAPEYRSRGCIRAIMAEIEKDITDAEGVYLFANDGVVDFYPKFGFTRGREYSFSKKVSRIGSCRLERVPMDGPGAWARLKDAMEKSTFPTGCHMAANPGLIFFYVAQFMQDCVYHDAGTDTWVVAELEEGDLLLHNVFSAENVNLDDVIAAFGSEVKQVTLGFTPADPEGWRCEELLEEDCNFFVRGDFFRKFEAGRLRIPSLSHA